MIAQSDDKEAIARASPLYFRCADIALAVRELKARGVDLRRRAASHRRDGRPRFVDGVFSRSGRASDGADAGSAEGLCSGDGDWRRLSARGRARMAYWLFKTEADAWSWDEQKKKGAAGEEWTGVRNFQARGNMRKMKKGDRGFFYHTGDEKQVVGIVEVIKEAHPESKDADVGQRRPESRRRRAEAGDARRDQGRAEAEGDGAGQEFAPFGAAGQRRGVGARLQDGRRRRGEARASRRRLVPDLRRQSAPPPDALRQLDDHRDLHSRLPRAGRASARTAGSAPS